MALNINEDCIACDACVEGCPNEAISEGDPIYIINPDLCTECVGECDEPQCVEVCPADCILPDPENKESREELEAKYKKIHPGK